MIGVDGGSVDPGPYFLGAGKAFCSNLAMRRDLRLMLNAGVEAGIPVAVSTAGGAGGSPHVANIVDMVRQIAQEDGLHFKLAIIHSEQAQADVIEWVEAGRVNALGSRPPLTTDTVERATRIVGAMGPEPYMDALDAGADVIISGRSTDPAPWVAMVRRAGLPEAQAWYAGKMLECGAEPALPKKEDCLFVTVGADYVECEPTSQERRCTPLSVANFSLHENASPVHHFEPGGMLDTTECVFEAVSDRAVRITGMKWLPASQYTVKLEGVEQTGFRALAICGTRDPVLIDTIEPYLERSREIVAEKTAAFGVSPESYGLSFRVYGRNGVMGAREPVTEITSHELGFVIEVVASTQDEANAVVAIARTTLLHSDFPGRLCKEGNMAIPFSPSDIELGPHYRFSVYHIVDTDSPTAMFPIEYEQVGG
ncbi:acyclic terpene utilization AtuA family protein [Salinisphaera sp. T31B1]|uniref:acyclic terpene utilization AtuA family protein n=1 Tax=Salinisphaera sp. T31B1 TaxID=727963 RepID=UPI0033419868